MINQWNLTITLLFFSLSFLLISCENDINLLAEGVVHPDPVNFETTIDGKPVRLYTLQNEHGMRLDVTNHGARMVALLVPDQNGQFDDVITGYHSIDEFLESEEPYFGTIIGRYGNRIGGAAFTLDEHEYTLTANDGPNMLHGGPDGYHNVVWDVVSHTDTSIVMSYTSPHLEEGFPGTLEVTHTMTLTPDNGVILDYHATTDQSTVVNLTNHAFFNLAGEGNGSILDHVLKIYASHYTPVSDTLLIPTGEIAYLGNTPLDFRTYRAIGERINDDHEQLRFGLGYDHNYILDSTEIRDGLTVAAQVYEPVSRRKMEILTTEPGLQFYSGNFLTGEEIGKKGMAYTLRSSFCLETQHYPDSPNNPDFPSTRLDPGEEYQSRTIYQFGIKTENE